MGFFWATRVYSQATTSVTVLVKEKSRYEPKGIRKNIHRLLKQTNKQKVRK